MIIRKPRLILCCLMYMGAAGLYAQTPVDSIPAARGTIVDSINAGDLIFIDQPASLNQRLKCQSEPVKTTSVSTSGTAHARAGYRIQVFDDNNPRTARQQAQGTKAMIQRRFPQYNCYVSFESPYWRVRCGDFRTRAEAEAAMSEIKRAFPALSRSLHLVRDRVNVK